ncbi:efflux RND transporter permease subunit [Terricaulis silvestris]|uniref:Multidrug transporter MdtC n=1 Tax=Terricaulis silvestris TaxID=2686094 RepID=A0A6I6MI11_9CAUL|nr:efflux RND transporter permease subunit [Terricaulis silvestris]QGZ93321.1 Multidrug transporter MdtC [Terricaulis silvestris]
MAWNISAGAIRNPIPPILLILALVFAGWTAYGRLPINQLPNVDFGGFTVGVGQAGAAPEEMETQITQRIESALTSVEGVKRVTSTISPGFSNTVVEMESDGDLGRAVEDARDAINRIRSELPADISEPVITRLDAASQPIGYYAVVGEGMSPQDISWFIDNDLQRELLAVPGVSGIQRTGGVDREIRVELDPARMLAYGVSADAVNDQLRAMNVDLPGGQAQISGQAQSIRALGGAETIAQLNDLRISAADGRTVRLGDLGTITDAASDMNSVSRYNGQPVVGFAILRSRGASEVQVFDRMDERLREIERQRPEIEVREIFSTVEFIRGMHESSIHALIEGALLACLVVFLILRDWRATLIAAAAIPLSIFPTFAAIEVLGFTLNMVTLIALALVTGVLVDDAIVEIENIVRHMRMGKGAYPAALEAADEIGLAVVATTGAIIAVFVPVSFMEGGMGVFFREFGLTVAFAALFSLIVARLITPMMSAFFLTNKAHDHEAKPGVLTHAYRDTLSWSIRNPWKTIGVGLGVFIVPLVLLIVGVIPAVVIPRFDAGVIQARVEIPPGTPVLQADRVLQQMSARIRQTPEVEGVFTAMNGSDGSAPNADMFISLVDRGDRNKSAYAIQQVLRPVLSEFPDYRAAFVQDQGGSSGSDITVQFVGQDPAAVNAAADRLAAAMGRLPQLTDVRSTSALRRPELQIRPRQEDMARLGVSASALASAIRIATSGDAEQFLPRYDLADRQIPIRVTLRPDRRSDLDALRSLPVQSQLGEPVRLDAVADVQFSLGEAAIERRDRERAVTVGANVVPGVELSTAQSAVTNLPEAQNQPGARLASAGQTEDFAEMTASFGSAMLWGVILIYIVLVLLFRDFFQPITIMTALPLSIGGAFLGLIIANQPLSLFAFIGLLMLMGLVTKNSILLVDFAVERMHHGMSRNAALMEAGMQRARPIIMTTFAMSGGMLPAALGWGVDGTLRQGMGAAVIGGLMLSTLLSLVFVPAMFVLIDRLERWVQGFLPKPHIPDADDPVRTPAE